jgi:hypothetical protein
MHVLKSQQSAIRMYFAIWVAPGQRPTLKRGIGRRLTLLEARLWLWEQLVPGQRLLRAGLTRRYYSDAAVREMTENPQNRAAALAKLYESAGGKMESVY